jgi:hypothetical protein
MGGRGMGKMGLVVLRISAGGLGRQSLIWHFRLNKGCLNTITIGRRFEIIRQYI